VILTRRGKINEIASEYVTLGHTPPMSSPPWQSIRDRKVADRTARIPQEWLILREDLPGPDVLDVIDIPRTCSILTPEDIHITEAYDARSLAGEIRNGKLTAVDCILQGPVAFPKIPLPLPSNPRSTQSLG